MSKLLAKAYLLNYLFLIFVLVGCAEMTETISSRKEYETVHGIDLSIKPFPQNTTGIIWNHIIDSYSKKALAPNRKVFKQPVCIPAYVTPLDTITGLELQNRVRTGIIQGRIKVEEISEYSAERLIRIEERQTATYRGNSGVVATLEIAIPPMTSSTVIESKSKTFTIKKEYYNTTFDYKLSYPIVVDRETAGNVPDISVDDAHRTEWGYIAPVVLKDTQAGLYRMWYTKLNIRYNSSTDYTNLFENYMYEYITEYTTSPLGSISWSPNLNDNFSSGLTTSTTSTLEDKGGMVVFDAVKTPDYYYLWYIAKDSAKYDFSGSFNRKEPIQGRTWKLYSAFLDNSMPAWKRHDMGRLLLTLSTGSFGFDSSSIHKGSILYDQKSLSYKLWYTGSNGGSLDIGRATTFNGLTGGYKDKEREIFKGREGAFDSRDIADPFILKDGELYKMWYSGYNGFNWRIGMAYSWDGLNFTYYDEENYLPLKLSDEHKNPAVNYRFPCVVEDENGNYLLFYSKQNSNGTWQIEVSSSNKVTN